MSTPNWLEMDIAEARRIAAQPTPKPEAGQWMLISPSGKVYEAESPIHCVRVESNTRIPAEIALARIRVGMDGDE